MGASEEKLSELRNIVISPSCRFCPYHMRYWESVPQKQHGIIMHCGERFCTGKKRARRFKRYELEDDVPNWCPKKKKPCELRIYSLKNVKEWSLHTQACFQQKKAVYPTGSQYTLTGESYIDLDPCAFWDRCDYEWYADLLGVNLQLYEVAEIDDGLRPAFFYMTGKGLVPVTGFDVEAARKDEKEDT